MIFFPLGPGRLVRTSGPFLSFEWADFRAGKRFVFSGSVRPVRTTSSSTERLLSYLPIRFPQRLIHPEFGPRGRISFLAEPFAAPALSVRSLPQPSRFLPQPPLS